MPDKDLNARALREYAVQAAQGRKPFDLLIDDVVILDMVTGRERPASIGLVGPLIASVMPDGSKAMAKERIAGDGAWAVPGFIDTHMHIESSMLTPREYAAAVLPAGVTTVIWDPHEFANVCGVPGVEFATEAVRALPLRALVLAPTCVPSAPGYESSGGDFDAHTVASLLARDDIHGAAELMTMQPLLLGDPRVSGIAAATRFSGKRLCGHARGLTGTELNAYAAAGVETDHELTSAADLLARLEAGMTVELRGSHEHLLPEFAEAILSLKCLPQTITLCTDDVFPDDLHRRGGLDRLIRLLIRHGLPPAWVYRAATLNAAARSGRKDLGLIAPGKRADIVLLTDLAEAQAGQVFADGKRVACNGLPLDLPRAVPVPRALTGTVDVARLHPSDFEIKAPGEHVRLATLCKPRFPEWGERLVDVQAGVATLPNDITRMCVINRYGAGSPPRVACLEHWGRWQGAFASTVSHDSHNLTVFGHLPADMAVAANKVRDMGGGMAVVRDGQVTASIALPVAGLVSEHPLAAVAAEFRRVREATDAVVEWEPPYLVFKALFGASLVCNAGPRLSDTGIVDVFEGRVLEHCLIAE